MNRIAVILLLLPLMLCGGCATLKPGADPLVVNAERSVEVARVTLDQFVKFEFNNRSKCPKEVQDAAEQIRKDAPEMFNRVMRLKLAYKQNRSAEGKANLMTAVAVLSSVASEAATALAKYQH